MKIVYINDGKIGAKFETLEELDIFCRFYYNNDYFIRKCYTLVEYKNYISQIQETLYIDCDYHMRLFGELLVTIDNYKRKTKLKNINIINK